MNIKEFLPITNWLPTYNKSLLKGDLSAGLTVGVMLIPQGMAYALIAGLPPIYGLYASTIPIILYSIFGTSRQLAVGPVAMVSLLTAAGIGSIVPDASIEIYIGLAIALTLFVGAIQFLLGAFRLGFLVNFLSHPVISGFTSAAALIIGLSQLKHLLGIDIQRSHHIHEIILQAIEKFDATQWPTILLALGGIAVIIGIKKWNKAIPGTLVAVILGVVVVWAFGMHNMGVKIVGEVPSGLPKFGIPTFDMSLVSELLIVALTISLVSFMESIAVAKAIQSKHKNYQVIPNQELIALGVANIGGAFFQSYPVTGGFSRTAVNDQAGAKTGMAGIISAVLIIITLLFLTPLFYYLPKAILASVIMVAVFGLIDVKEAKHLWHSNRTDFWMLIVTFIGTLTLGIEQGIGLGVVLSLAMVVFRTTRPHIAELGKVPGSHFYRNVERFENLDQRAELLIMRFDAQLYFANINFFKDNLHRLSQKKGDTLKLIIIDCEAMNNMDSSAVHAVEDLMDDYGSRGIEVVFSGVKGPIRDALEKGHLTGKIGEDHFFMSIQEAVDCYDEKCISSLKKGPDYSSYTLQTDG
jgi:SulP family sulfate permease